MQESSRLGEPVKVASTVIGRWADDRVLVRGSGGESFELPVPERVAAGLEVGAALVVYVRDGEPVGWAFEGEMLGVTFAQTA